MCGTWTICSRLSSVIWKQVSRSVVNDVLGASQNVSWCSPRQRGGPSTRCARRWSFFWKPAGPTCRRAGRTHASINQRSFHHCSRDPTWRPAVLYLAPLDTLPGHTSDISHHTQQDEERRRSTRSICPDRPSVSAKMMSAARVSWMCGIFTSSPAVQETYRHELWQWGNRWCLDSGKPKLHDVEIVLSCQKLCRADPPLHNRRP